MAVNFNEISTDITADPCPEEFNMAAYVLAKAIETPDKTAMLVVRDVNAPAQEWSYRKLKGAIEGAAEHLLSCGYSPGDKLILRLGNDPEFPIFFFGAQLAGLIPVPVSMQMTETEVRSMIQTVEPQAICTRDEDFGLPAVDPSNARQGSGTFVPVRTRADDPAYIVFTSGTGARAKAVVHAHRAAWARRMMWQGWYGLQSSDAVFHAGAFNWTYTLGAGLTDPWAIGATSIIYNGPPSKTVWADVIETLRPTIFAAVPGIFRHILQTIDQPAQRLSSLRHALTAGEKLPTALHREWLDRCGFPLHEAFGMSEVSTFISSSPDRPAAPGTIGFPQPGRRIALQVEGDDTMGRVCVHKSDPGLMIGYHRKDAPPELPLEGEWFVTSDLARMNADGSLDYLGRADDVLTAGGYRVAAREVEEVLAHHPDVQDVCVIELEIRSDVPVITAFLVARSDRHLTEQQLSDFCKQSLAAYKIPRKFVYRDELPRSANGKVLKRVLRDEYNGQS